MPGRCSLGILRAGQVAPDASARTRHR
jgi:hypothetical protein